MLRSKRCWLVPLFLGLLAASFLQISGVLNERESESRLPARATPVTVRDAGNVESKWSSTQATRVGHPSFLSPHAKPISVHGRFVYVVNTPADTVDIINSMTRKVEHRINVGIDPVSLAVRPDGKELWVSNHVSDSVNVIDLNPKNRTYRQIVATIQEFDRNKATRFDEPMAIAFADNNKAYVALSSENQIAVIDVKSRTIKRRLNIPAQDPRDIEVRDGKLYVIPFESNNKTQLSGGSEIDGDLVTFNAWEHSIRVNNVLSIGHVLDIVKNPKVPDKDLFVFDTETDKLERTVDTLGTLLYGLTVDSQGQVFIAQTDARNDINGRSGTKKHSLDELENRAFLNQITGVPADRESQPRFINLEPVPPKQPVRSQALATPFAIRINQDDSTLYATAASSNQFFTVDAKAGNILDRIKVGSVPRGIAVDEGNQQAWVFNAVANTVSIVDVSDPAELKLVEEVKMEDPTHATFKRGRMAFNDASASSTGTFSCASCHPDGHTDQLLWVLKTPVVTGGNQIMPRSTMPLRGLRDTAPFHWDGIPGDPYGGNNSANIYSRLEPNSDVDRPESTTRHLIDGGLASTMLLKGDDTTNDEKKEGYLTAKQRDDMASFLLHVTFPPAQKRSYDNQLSKRARRGFELFHIVGDVGGTPGSNLCGNCHRMPFLVSTNTPGTGMDAPTWRGAYDRFLILPQGRLNIIDFPFYARIAERGAPERSVWQLSWGGRSAFDPVWEMVLEGSTGYSGAFARQVTLSQATVSDQGQIELVAALEAAARDGAIVLEGDGVDLTGKTSHQSFGLHFDGVHYLSESKSLTHQDLLAQCRSGEILVTLTARHGVRDDLDHPQPGLWTLSPIHAQSGRQKFPILYPEEKTMKINGRHVLDDAVLFVDGRRVKGTIEKKQGERLNINLDSLPTPGMHFLQVQNLNGLFSNDFIFHVVKDANEVKTLQQKQNPELGKTRLAKAIQDGSLERTKELIGQGVNVNSRREESGMTPLSVAAFHGRTEIANFLLEQGARINAGNRDGNTPLILAAFMCREEMCRLLVKKGASLTKRNHRRETPIDVVSGAWSNDLERLYRGIIRSSKMDLTASQMKSGRPKTKRLLEMLLSSDQDSGRKKPTQEAKK